MNIRKTIAASAIAVLGFGVSAANAAQVIDWTTWSSATVDTSVGNFDGTATGTLANGVTVTYNGEVESLVANYPSWGPAGTFNGGTVGNAPPQSGGIIQLFGGTVAGPNTDTISFSSTVTDPVLAIWSLGQGGTPASFIFSSNEPFSIESGGPSNEYGGSTITLTDGGLGVSGAEGNGTIQFLGTYNSISFTTPQSENWYGFTVGIGAVPEPSTWAMLLLGFFGVGFMMRASRRKATALTARSQQPFLK